MWVAFRASTSKVESVKFSSQERESGGYSSDGDGRQLATVVEVA